MKKRANVAIDSIYELQRVSEYFKMRLNDYVFRGQNKSAWDIVTSLERYCEGKKSEYWDSITGIKPIGTHLTKYLAKAVGANEYEGILEFSDNWEKDYGVRHDNLTNAALRRHFGCPSRLLDVTKSFDCALYFANDGKEVEDDSAIWAIRTDQIRKQTEKIFSTAKERFGDECWENRLVEEILCSEQTYESVPIVLLVGTMKCVPRMVAQEGIFLMPLSKCFMTSLSYTFSGRPALPITTISVDQFINGDQEPYPLVKFVLSRQMDDEVLDLLNERNLTKTRFFPDEEPNWLDHSLKVTFS